MLDGKLVALLGGAQEGLDGVRVALHEVVVGGQDRRVEVKDVVHVLEAEVVHRVVLDGGVLDGPALVDPHAVEHVGLQALDLIVHGEGDHLELGEVTTVGGHDLLDGCLLDGHAPGGVDVVLHEGGVGDAVLGAAHDAGGVVLDDGGHGGEAGVAGVVGGGQVVLVAHAQLGLAGADGALGGAVGRLDDLHLEALVGKEALALGHVDAGVVGVGGVVQAERDLGLLVGRGLGAGGGAVGEAAAGVAAGKHQGGGGGQGGAHKGAARKTGGQDAGGVGSFHC